MSSLTLQPAAPDLLFREARTAHPVTGAPVTGFDFPGVQKEFLDDDHTPLMVVNIGRPGADAWHARSPRLACGEVVTTV